MVYFKYSQIFWKPPTNDFKTDGSSNDAKEHFLMKKRERDAGGF